MAALVVLSTMMGAAAAASSVTVDAISPNELAAGITTTVAVLGSGFQPGATVSFADPTSTGSVSTAISVTVDSPTHITAAIHTGAPGGPLPNHEDVVVTNPDSGRGMLAGGLTVDIVPIPIHVYPDVVAQGTTVEVTLGCIRCGSPVVSASVSGWGVVVTRAFPDYRLVLQASSAAPLGDRVITVVTANRGTIPFSITVGPRPLPVISGFTPASGPAGNQVTISGTGFTGVSSVTLNGGPVNILSANATTIVVRLNSWNTTGRFTVTLPGGVSTTSAGVFTVTSASAGVLISGFTPASGPPGSQVTISGTGFTGVSSVTLNGGPVNILSASATTIVVRLNSWNTTGRFRVSLPGGVSATSAGVFTVT